MAQFHDATAQLPDGSVPLRSLSFRLERPTPLLNTTLRQHFHSAKRAQTALAWEIKLATEGKRPPLPFAFARVTIERRSIGIPDREGAIGGAKALIDCLVPFSKRHPRGLGIISDDNPAVMVAVYRLERVATRGEQCTLVTVEELDRLP